MRKSLGHVAALISAVLLAAQPALAGTLYTNGLTAASSPLTGAETIAVDTNLSGGRFPQQESVSTAQLAAMAPGRNVLVGGDFGTNPWQRGTSSLTATSTVTYTADGWFVRGSAGSAITVAKQTSSQQAGFGGSLRFQRDSANADTNALYLGQVLETANSYQLQGQTVALSFYAKAGANYSPTGGALGVGIGTGTGSNGSAANFLAGSWTGYAAASCDSSSVALTTSWARYTVVCSIPSTAAQVGVKFTMTPVGTASTNDWFEVTGIQLEAIPSGSTIATPFEFQPAQAVLSQAQRYYFRINEGAATVTYGTGQAYSTTVCHVQIPFPTTMRAAPTSSVTAGSFATTKSADGSSQALTTLAATASSNTTNRGDLTATASAANLSAGSACGLIGGGGSGVLAFSAEL